MSVFEILFFEGGTKAWKKLCPEIGTGRLDLEKILVLELLYWNWNQFLFPVQILMALTFQLSFFSQSLSTPVPLYLSFFPYKYRSLNSYHSYGGDQELFAKSEAGTGVRKYFFRSRSLSVEKIIHWSRSSFQEFFSEAKFKFSWETESPQSGSGFDAGCECLRKTTPGVIRDFLKTLSDWLMILQDFSRFPSDLLRIFWDFLRLVLRLL